MNVHGSWAVALFFCCEWASAGGGDRIITTHTVNATDPTAVCLDGSPGEFHFRAGVAPTRKWVISFEGGGWCYSETDCWKRSRGALGSSKRISAPTVFEGPLENDCVKNPELCTYNHVLLKYCDGNSFSGNRDAPIEVNGDKLYFRGHRILAAALKMLLSQLGMHAAEAVLLTGCSAGGLSTLLHADYVGNVLKAGTKGLQIYKVLPLSSIFPTTIPNVAGQFVFAEQMKAVYELHNASSGVHQGCIQNTPLQDQWQCNTAQRVYPLIDAPVMLVQSLYDAWSTSCIFGAQAVPPSSPHNGNCSGFSAWRNCLGAQTDINFMGPDSLDLVWRQPSKCSGEQVASINSEWRDGVLALIQAAPTYSKPGNGAFMHSCYIHCASLADHGGLVAPTCKDCWNSLAVGGVSIQQAVHSWWNSSTATPAAHNVHVPCSWSNTTNLRQCNPTCGKN